MELWGLSDTTQALMHWRILEGLRKENASQILDEIEDLSCPCDVVMSTYSKVNEILGFCKWESCYLGAMLEVYLNGTILMPKLTSLPQITASFDNRNV